MCRQTLAEFCEADLPVYCDEGDGDGTGGDGDGGEDGPVIAEYTLGELIPATISRETLGR
jgi:cytidine deaminase